MRVTVCFALTSFPVPGTPALRKYFEAMMSVASWLQDFGISRFSSLKTVEPSGFEIFELRRSHSIMSKGSTPGVVYTLLNFTPLAFDGARRRVLARPLSSVDVEPVSTAAAGAFLAKRPLDMLPPL